MSTLSSLKLHRLSIRPKVENPMKNGITIRLDGSILDTSSAKPAPCCARLLKRDRL